jgi:hypothetical protein
MSSPKSENPAAEAIRTLRLELREDLTAFADLDVHFFAGYVIGWLATRLDLTELEDLVDELDDTVRVEGRRLLERRHSV